MNELYTKIHSNLPIFKIDLEQYTILYTPGHIITSESIDTKELLNQLKNPLKIGDNKRRNDVLSLIEKAQQVKNNWDLQKNKPFSPECLTIHAGSDCNMNCSYCYTKSEKNGNINLTGFPHPDAIEATLSYIARNIIDNQRKLTVVYHGSGEPTFQWQKLVDSHKCITKTAGRYGLDIFSYIATNGALTKHQIDWLTANIDLIGISCDGPVDIQSKQRKHKSIQQLSIENVCLRIIENGGKFDIRVTVTRNTILKLPEITSYLVNECKAKSIRIEPQYLAGTNGFSEQEAEMFYIEYTKAKSYAKQNGATFEYSGIRLNELHGPYCDVLRNNLRVTADGIARNCFCFIRNHEDFITGQYIGNLSVFDIVPDINKLKSKAFQIPDDCEKCINVYHCSRGCPDFCILETNTYNPLKLDPFRCQLHKLLAIGQIIEAAHNQKNNE